MNLVSIVAISIIIFIEVYCIIERICTCIENSVKSKSYWNAYNSFINKNDVNNKKEGDK